MRRAIATAAVLAFAFSAFGAAAATERCKDPKTGRFIKCPVIAPGKVVKCKDAKGKFAKCGTPGATPVA